MMQMVYRLVNSEHLVLKENELSVTQELLCVLLAGNLIEILGFHYVYCDHIPNNINGNKILEIHSRLIQVLTQQIWMPKVALSEYRFSIIHSG